MEPIEKRSFEQQLAAIYVARELKHQPGSLMRIRFLRVMMNGTKETEKLDDTHFVERRYAICFEGVKPITDLLDPDWDYESHAANKVLVSSVVIETKANTQQAA